LPLRFKKNILNFRYLNVISTAQCTLYI